MVTKGAAAGRPLKRASQERVIASMGTDMACFGLGGRWMGWLDFGGGRLVGSRHAGCGADQQQLHNQSDPNQIRSD